MMMWPLRLLVCQPSQSKQTVDRWSRKVVLSSLRVVYRAEGIHVKSLSLVYRHSISVHHISSCRQTYPTCPYHPSIANMTTSPPPTTKPDPRPVIHSLLAPFHTTSALFARPISALKRCCNHAANNFRTRFRRYQGYTLSAPGGKPSRIRNAQSTLLFALVGSPMVATGVWLNTTQNLTPEQRILPSVLFLPVVMAAWAVVVLACPGAWAEKMDKWCEAVRVRRKRREEREKARGVRGEVLEARKKRRGVWERWQAERKMREGQWAWTRRIEAPKGASEAEVLLSTSAGKGRELT